MGLRFSQGQGITKVTYKWMRYSSIVHNSKKTPKIKYTVQEVLTVFNYKLHWTLRFLDREISSYITNLSPLWLHDLPEYWCIKSYFYHYKWTLFEPPKPLTAIISATTYCIIIALLYNLIYYWFCEMVY